MRQVSTSAAQVGVVTSAMKSPVGTSDAGTLLFAEGSKAGDMETFYAGHDGLLIVAPPGSAMDPHTQDACRPTMKEAGGLQTSWRANHACNQTVIFALFMVIIGAMIGTDDLGQFILKALSDKQGGLMLGLCVAFIGLAVDHLINTWAAERKDALGIR